MGALVGRDVGCRVGALVGFGLGFDLGGGIGALVGFGLGFGVGGLSGALVGFGVGGRTGASVGFGVGGRTGALVGLRVGGRAGTMVGLRVGGTFGGLTALKPRRFPGSRIAASPTSSIVASQMEEDAVPSDVATCFLQKEERSKPKRKGFMSATTLKNDDLCGCSLVVSTMFRPTFRIERK
jgi:hypothetical protein